MKPRRAFGHPADEFCQPRVALQRRNRVKRLRQLGLTQGGVDLIVTDLMQKHGFPAFAPAQTGNQMVFALPRRHRDRAATQRADRIILVF